MVCGEARDTDDATGGVGPSAVVRVALSSSREGRQATMTDLCLRVRWSSGDHFRSDFSS